jgi:hypothetical protein
MEMTEKVDQGQYCKGNLERTDVWEAMLGATGMQQKQSIRNRGPKERLHLGSRRILNKTFRQTVGLEIMK